MADGMRVTLSADRVWDAQTVVIGRDGHFEFVGLDTGTYELFTSVKGYELQDNQETLATVIDRDQDGFIITLKRATRQ
jgi:hypothetical protein